MLEVQKYLRGGNTPEKLKEELGIKFYRHPDLPLVGFKYSQIDSPRGHPIVLECRGIVLEEGTWDVIAKPFNRFFNVGEYEDEFKSFNWKDFTVTDKVDGSLAIVYYHEHWNMNTSGSFGLGNLEQYGNTWRELFLEASGGEDPLTMDTIYHRLDKKKLNNHTLIFELCTPYNKVVARHPTPTIYLLGASKLVPATNSAEAEWAETYNWADLSEEEVDELGKCIGVQRPSRHHLHSHDEIHNFLMAMSEADPTYEGVILRDANSRWKWKTSTYVALHHLKDNGNIMSPNRLVPLVLGGEMSETLSYMPEITSAVEMVSEVLDKGLDEMLRLWRAHYHLESQKDFALSVKGHKLCSMLFANRKVGGDEESLRKLFRSSEVQLSKTLFGKQFFKFDDVTEVDGKIEITRNNFINEMVVA